MHNYSKSDDFSIPDISEKCSLFTQSIISEFRFCKNLGKVQLGVFNGYLYHKVLIILYVTSNIINLVCSKNQVD